MGWQTESALGVIHNKPCLLGGDCILVDYEIVHGGLLGNGWHGALGSEALTDGAHENLLCSVP
jgi:hypothetical protein